MTIHFLAALRANSDGWRAGEIDFATFTSCRQDTWDEIRRSGTEIEAEVLRVLRDQLPTSATATTKNSTDEQDRRRTAAVAAIAQTHLQIDTLELRYSDALDFHELDVPSIRGALEAAYCAGMISLEALNENCAPVQRLLANTTARANAAGSKRRR
jgi:hypothetical protein